MPSILIAMVVILALAGLVIYYVAYPHRDEESGLGETLRDMGDRLPILEEDPGDTPGRHAPGTD
ncbi:hypothetical protein [Nocardioides acrostichi]|uniref:Uncharacterized protein n=1 Tax=Nocardioides acrostichi TaxID=2784339 RepID=A0A930UTA1_9ACTN|nr:hypothetical protein [Nocardioides acrostichi]MBF4160438.1 hypothetical protein [Nocardioides acrostichi]